MEPMLDKLSVHLVSCNMAMEGVGTLQFSLTGKYLYGEGDIIEWDSFMTEKGPTVDFFLYTTNFRRRMCAFVTHRISYEYEGENKLYRLVW